MIYIFNRKSSKPYYKNPTRNRLALCGEMKWDLWYRALNMRRFYDSKSGAGHTMRTCKHKSMPRAGALLQHATHLPSKYVPSEHFVRSLHTCHLTPQAHLVCLPTHLSRALASPPTSHHAPFLPDAPADRYRSSWSSTEI